MYSVVLRSRDFRAWRTRHGERRRRSPYHESIHKATAANYTIYRVTENGGIVAQI